MAVWRLLVAVLVLKVLGLKAFVPVPVLVGLVVIHLRCRWCVVVWQAAVGRRLGLVSCELSWQLLRILAAVVECVGSVT